MEVLSLIERAWAWISGLLYWKHTRALKAMKAPIQKYMEDAQTGAHGGVGYSFEMLEKDKVFETKDQEIAKEAIELLCLKRILEYFDGRYYVKGNAPKY